MGSLCIGGGGHIPGQNSGAGMKVPHSDGLAADSCPLIAAERAAHLSWHGSWYVIPGHGLPQPLSPQTTVPFSSASSALRALTQLSAAPIRGETQPHSLSPQALDGAGSTPEQPQPGQQCVYRFFIEQPEHQGPSVFWDGMGRKGTSGCPVPLPSCGFCATTGTLVVEDGDP